MPGRVSWARARSWVGGKYTAGEGRVGRQLGWPCRRPGGLRYPGRVCMAPRKPNTLNAGSATPAQGQKTVQRTRCIAQRCRGQGGTWGRSGGGRGGVGLCHNGAHHGDVIHLASSQLAQLELAVLQGWGWGGWGEMRRGNEAWWAEARARAASPSNRSTPRPSMRGPPASRLCPVVGRERGAQGAWRAGRGGAGRVCHLEGGGAQLLPDGDVQPLLQRLPRVGRLKLGVLAVAARQVGHGGGGLRGACVCVWCVSVHVCVVGRVGKGPGMKGAVMEGRRRRRPDAA